MSDYREDLEKRLEQASQRLAEAAQEVQELTAAITAIDNVRTGRQVLIARQDPKPKKKKRGVLRRGVLDAIRERRGTVNRIKTYLGDRGVITSSASISNAIQRLQAEKLIEKRPGSEDWVIATESNPRTAAGFQNDEGPTDRSAGPLYQNGEAGLRPA